MTSNQEGLGIYRMFIKYCVFFQIFWNIPISCLSLFSFGVSVSTHTRQVKHQRCSRTGRVQKNFKEKKTIFNEHPVPTNGFLPSYGQSVASTQYFLQLAAYLGIPVIAWNPDNSGLEKVKNFIFLHLC